MKDLVSFMFESSSLWELICLIIYVFTDMLPISLMCYYHHSNFRTLAVQREVSDQQTEP